MEVKKSRNQGSSGEMKSTAGQGSSGAADPMKDGYVGGGRTRSSSSHQFHKSSERKS